VSSNQQSTPDAAPFQKAASRDYSLGLLLLFGPHHPVGTRSVINGSKSVCASRGVANFKRRFRLQQKDAQ